MKYYVALLLALAVCEFAGPPVAGSLGFQATSGLDSADMLCIAMGVGAFALTLVGASYF